MKCEHCKRPVNVEGNPHQVSGKWFCSWNCDRAYFGDRYRQPDLQLQEVGYEAADISSIQKYRLPSH